MADPKQLSLLIGRIYDATLDPALWPVVLEQISEFVPGAMANLFSQDSINKHANRFFTWGDDPHYTALYLEKYATLNPLFPSGLFFPVGEVYGQVDIMPHEELRQTRFYKEWMQPQGIVDFVGCNLEKSATSVAPLAVVQHERHGLVTAAMRARMELITPHVRRAVAIGKVIDLHKVEAASLADALDGLAAAMFLVDANARLTHANAAGTRMLDEGAVLRIAGGRVLAHDPQASQALHEVFAAADAGDAAVGVKGIAMPLRGRGTEEFVAHVLPLTSAARRQAGLSYAAVAAVFVQKAALDLQSPPEALGRRFNLTAGELRVLLAMMNTAGVAEVAEALGIGEGTVRTHLHRLFEKTGTSRQADLVKLVGGFASPLAD